MSRGAFAVVFALAVAPFAMGCAEGLPSAPSGKQIATPGGDSDGGTDASTSMAPKDASAPIATDDLGWPLTEGGTPSGDGGGGGGIDASCGTACCNGKQDANSPTFESDVDCGGPVCRKCMEGETCIANTDCESKICNTGKTCDPTPAGTGGTSGGGMCCTDPGGNCTMMTNGTHVYYFCDTDSTWSTARASCMGGGMDLAHVDDAAENDFLSNGIRDLNNNKGWTGGTVLAGAWIWIDTTMPWSYMNGSPAATNNNCLMVDDNGNWNSQPCTDSFGYVCEGMP